MNDAEGFTLLEMLVVVTILSLAGMIVGVAIPRTGERAAIERTKDEVVKVLLETRMQAQRSSSPRRVVFDLDRRMFQAEGAHAWRHVPEGIELSIVSAREFGVPRRPAVVFLGDGTNSGVEITLEGRGYARKIRLDWLTGKVVHAVP